MTASYNTRTEQTMGDARDFAADIFRIICRRFAEKATDLQLMIETTSSFEEWINWEAFLACKHQQTSYPFCEVTAKPTYSSEDVTDDDGNPDKKLGDLRVGGTYDAGDHRWLFAEFALLHDGNRIGDKWWQKVEEDAVKLKRLGWKRSASVLIVVAASRGDVLSDWAADLAGSPVWNQTTLTEPFTLALPDGGSVVLKAFDIKRDLAHTLTTMKQ